MVNYSQYESDDAGEDDLFYICILCVTFAVGLGNSDTVLSMII